MSLYNVFARHVFAPAYDVLRGTHTARCLGELERSQWWPLERIDELQSRRLRMLIDHAYRTVPHYRAIMIERGLTPADIRSAPDLQALPVLTRPDVQERGAQLLAEGFPTRSVASHQDQRLEGHAASVLWNARRPRELRIRERRSRPRDDRPPPG